MSHASTAPHSPPLTIYRVMAQCAPSPSHHEKLSKVLQQEFGSGKYNAYAHTLSHTLFLSHAYTHTHTHTLTHTRTKDCALSAVSVSYRYWAMVSIQHIVGGNGAPMPISRSAKILKRQPCSHFME